MWYRLTAHPQKKRRQCRSRDIGQLLETQVEGVIIVPYVGVFFCLFVITEDSKCVTFNGGVETQQDVVNPFAVKRAVIATHLPFSIVDFSKDFCKQTISNGFKWDDTSSRTVSSFGFHHLNRRERNCFDSNLFGSGIFTDLAGHQNFHTHRFPPSVRSR